MAVLWLCVLYGAVCSGGLTHEAAGVVVAQAAQGAWRVPAPHLLCALLTFILYEYVALGNARGAGRLMRDSIMMPLAGVAGAALQCGAVWMLCQQSVGMAVCVCVCA